MEAHKSYAAVQGQLRFLDDVVHKDEPDGDPRERTSEMTTGLPRASGASGGSRFGGEAADHLYRSFIAIVILSIQLYFLNLS